MSDYILELKSLNKNFGVTQAVKDVSLSIKKGEFVTFLGPSGSGKTTTLMMVAGFLKVSSGDMLLNGQPLDPLPPYNRNIGMVFQHYALFPHMTVSQNVAFPLEMRNVSKEDTHKQVKDALSMVGLPDHGDRYPKQLSGGQQQRVALARAMVFKPQLLLMDEPLGALDKNLREHMQIEIMRLHQELGVTVLYVTHDQEEALVMSDRIVVFNDGMIQQVGSPTELYENPSTKFVANFIGESNFIDGKLVNQDGDIAHIQNGTAFSGRAAADLQVDSNVTMTVRPERLRLALTDNKTTDDNAVEATVSDIIYLGKFRKYISCMENGNEVTVLAQPNLKDQDLTGIEVGSRVKLLWSQQDCKVLAAK